MTHRLFVILLAICVVVGAHVDADPLIIQYAMAQSAGAQTTITTTAMSTTTGRAIIVFIGDEDQAWGATPVTDSGSHSWNLAVATTGNAQGNGALYYTTNITGSGSHTFTFTASVADFLTIVAVEVSGLAASPLDQSDADNTTGTNHTTGPITAAAGICELLIAAGSSSDNGGPNHEPSTPIESNPAWIYRAMNGTASANGIIWAWRIVTSGASSSWTYATPDSDADMALIAGFKAAACTGTERSQPF